MPTDADLIAAHEAHVRDLRSCPEAAGAGWCAVMLRAGLGDRAYREPDAQRDAAFVRYVERMIEMFENEVGRHARRIAREKK